MIINWWSKMSSAKKKVDEKAKKSIQGEIGDKEKVFVLFYATWCPHSQRFLPIFQEYSNHNPDKCVSFIIDDRPDICEEYAIEYYPTVIMFKNGKEHKRLDAEPGVGLSKKQLMDFTEIE
jgi:thioredoxin 1